MPTRLYTLGDLLAQHAGRESLAVIDGEERISYAELLDRSRRFAALLRDAGVKRGDRVPIFLRRSARALIAFFGTHFAGGVAVFVNDRLRAAQVSHILAHAEADLLVAEGRLLRNVKGLEIDEGRVLNLDETELPSDAAEPAPTIGKDLALLIYTSGSTGLPKGIMLSHRSVLEGALTVSDYLRLSERDIVISLLPYSFDYGLNQVTTTFLVGATLVIERSLFPADICAALQREKVTGFAGVPMLWSQLAQDYSPFLKTELPDLRYMTNTGGHFPESLIERFRKAHPHVDIYPMYGLTEAFRSTYLPPDQIDRRKGSMGRAVPNVEILVVDEEGNECAPGVPGELVHRGAHVALGYWRDPETTARVYRPHPRLGDVETVVYSGDLVKKDDDGFLYYVGRRDQMIKSMGFRVSPEEIEHYIQGSGLVAHVAAFAVPEGDVGTEIVAAVVPADADEEALQEYCKREMPEYMRPATIWTVDEFPQTTSGKPDRNRLKESYLAR